ncbi:exo-alpha-sialidase [Mucilaginibacter ximonensis]|uniref:Exo-alpha-sialidase n=1 Tax=Mucilaginibacter ximonensis TaxID=538021 RepID=A0ABW5YDJ6_9SPHI
MLKPKLYLLPLLLIVAMSSVAQQAKTPVGGIRIAWDYNTLVKVSSNNARYSGYARLIQLADNSLLGVYESEGSVYCVKSNDLGKSWSAQTLIAPHADGVNMAVPDILQLKDHSLLVCYNPRPSRRPIDTTKHFAIKTKKSYDHGKTWTDERTLYKADYRFENGCWEPSAIQLPDADVELFFANEDPYRQSNEQCISMVKSRDGGLSWSAAKTTSFRPHSRDGMPSPILLQNGKEMAYSIEDNGFKNFKPTIIRSTLKDDWSKPVGATSPNRNFALADKVPDSLYLGAPYLRRLKTGETILSYQGTEGRINNMNHSEMKVVVGDNEGRNFNRKSVPFNIAGDKAGLWNSVCVLNDNTVVALTSTSSFSQNHNTEVWMIKGHVMPELSVKRAQIHNDPSQDSLETKVFIGGDGLANLKADLNYNDQMLYVMVAVRGVDSLKNASFTIYLDPQNKSYDAPGKGVFKITMDRRNELTMFEGDSGEWKKGYPRGILNDNNMRAGKRYTQVIGIPWSIIGGRPAAGKRVGFNMALTDSNGHTENISSNEADKPFTWCTLKLY